MRVERAARKADVGRPIVAEPLHQVLAAADHADRKSAADRLAIGHEVGPHAEVFLRAAKREAKADEHLVEDQNDIPLGADRAQPLEPFGVGCLVETGVPRAVHQRGVRRRPAVRMQRLQRIDQDAGDVVPRPQHAQRVLGHVLQRIGVARRQRIADARLHVAPPAVIGAAEAHQVRAAGVIAREPHRLHDRLGARHVERHFVEAGDLLQAPDVVGDHRMIRAEHRTEVADPLMAALHAGLVEIVAEQIDAVRAGEVVERVAVEVGDRHAAGRLQERAERQVLAHDAAVLERHPIGVGELQIGNAVGHRRGGFERLRKVLLEMRRQPHEAGPALRGDRLGRIVGAEEPRFVVFVERQERRHAPRHPGVSGQRSVLRLGQLQPLLELHQRGRQGGRAEPAECQCRAAPFHRIGVYPREFTGP